MSAKRKPTTKPAALPLVVNLAEMGRKPEWAAVTGAFASLPESTRHVLLHWLAFHLGSARTDHESDPLAPASYRDHCCGRATTANQLLAEARALMLGQPEAVSRALKVYFGAGKEEQE
jgi:hypothetical protein